MKGHSLANDLGEEFNELYLNYPSALFESMNHVLTLQAISSFAFHDIKFP